MDRTNPLQAPSHGDQQESNRESLPVDLDEEFQLDQFWPKIAR